MSCPVSPPLPLKQHLEVTGHGLSDTFSCVARVASKDPVLCTYTHLCFFFIYKLSLTTGLVFHLHSFSSSKYPDTLTKF